jgi:hypothetical protein
MATENMKKSNMLSDDEIENVSGGASFQKCPGNLYESAFPEATCRFCSHFSMREESDGKHVVLICSFDGKGWSGHHEERKSVDFWNLWE